jgi:hypothetical protein
MTRLDNRLEDVSEEGCLRFVSVFAFVFEICVCVGWHNLRLAEFEIARTGQKKLLLI